MKFKVFGYNVEITRPKIWVAKQYKPGIYVFWDAAGKYYYDFIRSFDRDTKYNRQHELFGPFVSESDACADWLKGCKTHGYTIPWPVIPMGQVETIMHFRTIRGSWDSSDGILRTHG